MSTFDKLFTGFIAGMLFAALMFGVVNYNREVELRCWKLKVQEHNVGYRGRNC